MLACGLTLQEVLEGVTLNPKAVLQEADYGVLKEGEKANFTVFDVVQGDFTFEDVGALEDSATPESSYRTPFPGKKFIRPRWVYYSGIFSEAEARGLDESHGP